MEDERLSWIEQDEQTRQVLDDRWSGWDTASDDGLAATLDEQWQSGWEDWDPDLKVSMLRRLVREWYPDSAGDGPSDAAETSDSAVSDTDEVGQLAWVTDEQAAALDAYPADRGDWREWLPAELDAAWSDWRQSQADVLVPWLDQWMPSLLGGVADGVDADVSQVRDLAWVTAEQRSQLDLLQDTHGDWTQWLPEWLDAAWADWQQSTPEVLSEWFAGLLPSLVGDETDGAESTEGAGTTQGAADSADVVEDGFEEGDLGALFDDSEFQELAGELAELTEEELTELAEEVAAMLAADAPAQG